jgi:hypothetical protein
MFDADTDCEDYLRHADAREGDMIIYKGQYRRFGYGWNEVLPFGTGRRPVRGYRRDDEIRSMSLAASAHYPEVVAHVDLPNQRGCMQFADGSWALIGKGKPTRSPTAPPWAGGSTLVILRADLHRAMALLTWPEPNQGIGKEAYDVLKRFFSYSPSKTYVPGLGGWRGCPSIAQLLMRYRADALIPESEREEWDPRWQGGVAFLEQKVADGWQVDWYRDHPYEDELHLYKAMPMMSRFARRFARRWTMLMMRKLCEKGRAPPAIDVFELQPARHKTRHALAQQARYAAISAEARLVRMGREENSRRVVSFL